MASRISLILGSVAALSLLAACGSGAPEQEVAPEPEAVETEAVETEVGAGDEAAVDETAAADEAADVVTVSVGGLSGNSAAGEKVYVQCKACHSVNPGENRVGPTLHAIVGAHASHIEGFNYSKANRESGLTWDEETLFKYLEDPRGMVPGTTMAFPGVKDAQKRADLIAYLKAQS